MISSAGCRILYLVHDISDAAVARRIAMLRDGGATVTLAGFRRTAEPASAGVIDLGQTHNGRFVQRILAVLLQVMTLGRYKSVFADHDIILARNLEMLAIGVRARGLMQPKPVLVYESLDIHRLLLDDGIPGKILRRLEGWLSRRASALITSSPSFVSEYFTARSQVKLPIRLVENKVYPAPALEKPDRKSGPPWRIGWFGAIRCAASLELLRQVVAQSNGTVQVMIRGRPALDQFDDFMRDTGDTPGLQFLGPYHNPGDLAAIYNDVHFTWAIDRFEAGQNSSWLLPNRLYEGGLFASVPIAEKAVETGRFIDRLGIGLSLRELEASALIAFLSALAPATYKQMEAKVAAIDPATWVCNAEECQQLVAFLQSCRAVA